jgi:hypothetical protein
LQAVAVRDDVDRDMSAFGDKQLRLGGMHDLDQFMAELSRVMEAQRRDAGRRSRLIKRKNASK